MNKRLVLGFDGGCFACSELARRIEECAGDNLEVRGLREPQVEEWRRRALGEDAPWAPTLIEVEGLRVRAWTGRRMGLALSRSLGPVATWRVLQVLGEVGAAKKVEESPVIALVGEVSRGQFLKGVAGAAVALSVLPGAAVMFSPTAEAKKGKSQLVDATPEQRKKAIAIVRDSKQYIKKANFDFDNAVIKVGQSGNFGVVRVVSDYADEAKEIYSAVFIVDFRRKEAILSGGAEFAPNSSDEIKVTSLSERNLPSSHRYIIAGKRDGKKYVRTPDGREITPKQFKKEIESFKHQQQLASQQQTTQGTVTTQQYETPDSPYEQCLVDAAAEQQEVSSSCDLYGIGINAGDLATTFIPYAPDLVLDVADLALGIGCFYLGVTAPPIEEVCAGYSDDA